MFIHSVYEFLTNSCTKFFSWILHYKFMHYEIYMKSFSWTISWAFYIFMHISWGKYLVVIVIPLLSITVVWHSLLCLMATSTTKQKNCVHMHTHMCTHTRAHAHTHTHTHIHTRTHTYTHLHVHTNIASMSDCLRKTFYVCIKLKFVYCPNDFRISYKLVTP